MLVYERSQLLKTEGLHHLSATKILYYIWDFMSGTMSELQFSAMCYNAYVNILSMPIYMNLKISFIDISDSNGLILIKFSQLFKWVI